MKTAPTILPRLSEKSYDLSLKRNCFVFIVPAAMNRFEVISAVKKQYEVDAIKVNMANVAGKSVRSYQNRRFVGGQRNSYKKAYVTLKEGQTLAIFAGNEDAEDNNQGPIPRSAKRAAKEKK